MNPPVLENIKPDNSPEKVAARERILKLEREMREGIAAGSLTSVFDKITFQHFFAPTKDQKYIYTRVMHAPKDSVIVGKIHRYPCTNFVMKGKIVVATDEGNIRFEAPTIFVSPAGIKRVGWVEEDVIWVTSHLTENCGVENIGAVEDEIVAPSFEELGLMSSVSQLKLSESIKQVGEGQA